MDVIGTVSNDVLIGTPDDDTFTGLQGDDTINGGDGIDTAVFASSSSNYSLTFNVGGGLSLSGPDGFDVLTSIEQLQFDLMNGQVELIYSVGIQTAITADLGTNFRVASFAGDVNGDGFGDFIIGSRFSGPIVPPGNHTGEAWLVFGTGAIPTSTGLDSLNGNDGFNIVGGTNQINGNDQIGASVTGLGDFNGDGIDDFAVSGPGVGTAGDVYIVFGQGNGFQPLIDLTTLTTETGLLIRGIGNSQNFGSSISGVGDINGDGFDDLLIGEDKTDNAFLVLGNNQGSNSVATVFSSGSFSGRKVAHAGDFNGDGLDDLLIGTADFPNGSVHVIFGDENGFGANFDFSGLNGSNGFTIVGNDDDRANNTGFSFSGLGDVNADGLDDIGVFVENVGYFVIYGSSGELAADFFVSSDPGQSSLSQETGFLVTVPGAGVLPRKIGQAGDFNGDGIDDFFVTDGGATTGQVFIIFGSTSIGNEPIDVTNLTIDLGVTIDGVFMLSNAPDFSTAGIGDVNGDGFDDLFVGGIVQNQQNQSFGSGAIYYGFSTDPIFFNVITGTEVDDVLTGTEGDDEINGLGGDDTIEGLGGADLLIGGAGGDVISGGDGNDTLFGGAGGDQLIGNAGFNILNGGAGNDTLYIGDRDETSGIGEGEVFGGDGNDLIRTFNGVYNITVYAGNDDDFLVGRQARFIDMGSGDDQVQINRFFTQQPELIDGGAGFDRINILGGGAGDIAIDFSLIRNFEFIEVDRNSSEDELFVFSDANIGSSGALEVRTSNSTTPNAYTLDGSQVTIGNLTLVGAHGDDTLLGGDQADTLVGSFGNDTLVGGGGNDVLFGDNGTDIAVFSGSSDQYTVTVNADGSLTVEGIDGTDTLFGINQLQFDDQSVVTSDLPPFENSEPTVDAVTSEGLENDLLTGIFSGFDVDENDELTFTITSLPPLGTVINNGDSTFTFDPGADFDDLSAGETRLVTFSYVANDDSGADNDTSEEAIVSITVTGSNDAPIAGFVSTEAIEDASVTGSFDGSDVDRNDELTFAITSAPVLGSAISNNDGTFTFDPGTDFDTLSDGETQLVTFTYVASDDSGADNDTSEEATVSITVTGINDVPEAVSDELTVNEDDRIVRPGNLLSNDQDPDTNDILRVASVNGSESNVGGQVILASGAILNVQADGTWSYDPNGVFADLNDGETALDSFSYTISDGISSATTDVSISINGSTDQVEYDNIQLTFEGINILRGTDGNDLFADFRGDNDAMIGSAGSDTLIGGEGSDLLLGNALVSMGVRLQVPLGDSALHSFMDTFDPRLVTGVFDFFFADEIVDLGNTLDGGAGDDFLLGGRGDDTLIGGSGADVFVFSGGQDVIEDFNSAEGDIIRLGWLDGRSETQFAKLQGLMTESGGDTIIDFGNGTKLILEGVVADSLQASDFLF